ncbi:MAG: protein kinase [Burkholderiaceae bacterium]
MPRSLSVSIGQHTSKGRKAVNQDFHGACVPAEPLLSTKGIALAIADGISTSQVSQEASEAAVRGFLEDYFCTSEAWSVKRAARSVLAATNAWLHSQTLRSEWRFDKDRGYVCTFSALILKSNTAHLFHAGDSRIYRLHPSQLEQLTEDHRLRISSEQSYLTRALGMHTTLDIDYQTQPLAEGDVYLLVTDGVYEHIGAGTIHQALAAHPDQLDEAAQAVVRAALEAGSEDNLSVQIVRIERLPAQDLHELTGEFSQLALPPILSAREESDGYRVVRQLHASSRSHIYLAHDIATGDPVALKIPSVDQHGNEAHLERFALEEWIARRINSPYVLKPCITQRPRQHLLLAMEYVPGQTLTQWMADHPRPTLETVRAIVEQMAKGLQAFHRLEMLHQDLRPANILIDSSGSVKIIDFGSTRVAGLAEVAPQIDDALWGTAQYTAPEYFLGARGTEHSEQFSLGVIAYQMLTGRLPYGAEVAKTRTTADQQRLVWQDLTDERTRIPLWVEGALRRALHPDPSRRYKDLAEFTHDLRHPNPEYLRHYRPPLVERHPVAFWKGVSLLLLLALLIALERLFALSH